MRIPDPPSDDHMSMTSSEDEHTRSAQRRNLLVIVGVAAVLSVAAWAVGRIDHEFEMRTYTRRWQEADCRVLDKRMEVDGVPQGPPEIDIPDEQVFRGAVEVEVQPHNEEPPFEAVAYDTLAGRFSEFREFEDEWLDSHPVNQTELCFWGPFKGERMVVFDLAAALSDIKRASGGLLVPNRSSPLHTAMLALAFFALLAWGFAAMRFFRGGGVARGDKDDGLQHDERQPLRGEEAVGWRGRLGGAVGWGMARPTVVTDLQAPGGVEGINGGTRELPLVGGTPREWGTMQEVNLT